MSLLNFNGNKQEFEEFVLSWHQENCGLPFVEWKATNWMQCPMGHAYWTNGTRYWSRPLMRGNEGK